jgi:signal peptidase II
MNKKLYSYLALATLIFIIDRLTKMAALAWCTESTHTVNSFLSFEVVFNRGISWGMFHGTSDTIFLFVSFIIAMVTAALCWYAYYNYVCGNAITGEVCIVAGSLCNLIDRAAYSGVIDFIILSYGNVSWPVFNIADAMIVFGVGMLVFQYEK